MSKKIHAIRVNTDEMELMRKRLERQIKSVHNLMKAKRRIYYKN